MKIALAQINPTLGNLQDNVEKILRFVQDAKEMQADIVVFPELVLTGYPPEDLLLKKHFIQRNLDALDRIVSKVSDVLVVLGFVDRDDQGQIYNAAAVIESGSIKGVYHKQNLPNYGVFDEKRYFRTGKDNPVFEYRGRKFAVNICEDIWQEKKEICLKQKKQGAEFLINLSSSPYEVTKIFHRQDLVARRAQQAGLPIVYVNLVGGQDELVFDGGSFVAAANGEVFGHCKRFEEDLRVVDLNNIENGSFQKDCVINEMTLVEEVESALVLGTRDYIQKNGFKKVLIGLSGGIDSAVVAVIAAKAIGPENVVCVSMPSRFNSEGTRSDARTLAKNLNVEFKEISIEKAFESYIDVLNPHFEGKESDVTEENIQARIRGNFLMALSNKFGWLVLTTGNKSEMAVGYCTLYGDMSGGFAVIKDVPKTLVFELSRFMNQNKELIPWSIINRPPSAELRDNQKDEDSLPPYEILDDIIERYVEQHEAYPETIKHHSAEVVQRVRRLIDLNEYKRRQAPIGPKITTRAFGKDWRLPITNGYRD